jgi:capsid protein
VSRVIKTESGELEGNSDFSLGTNPLATEPSDPKLVQSIVGGRVVSLKPGESIDTHQSQRPSPVFTGFLEHLKRDSSAGILPYEFVLDPSKPTGAAIRLVVAKADRRFSYRQHVLINRFLRPTWGFVIGDAIESGQLPFVEDWDKVEWVGARRITVDAGREAQQNRADVETGLKTLSDHFAELGMSFEEELERRARDARMILEAAAQHQVPVGMIWNPTGGISIAAPPQVDAGREKE